MFFTTVKNWYWYLGKLCVESWIRQLMLLQTMMGLQQKNLFSWVNYQPGQLFCMATQGLMPTLAHICLREEEYCSF